MNKIKPLLIKLGKNKGRQKMTRFSDRYADLLQLVVPDDEDHRSALARMLDEHTEGNYYKPRIEERGIKTLEGMYKMYTGLTLDFRARRKPEPLWIDAYGNTHSGTHSEALAKVPKSELHPIFESIIASIYPLRRVS